MVESLPTEILQNIFKNLNVKDLITCLGVCQQWKDAAGDVSECKWKAKCKKDFGGVFEDAYRKSCLSWRELHKSLSLWPDIQSARMFSRHPEFATNYNDIVMSINERDWHGQKRFFVLENGVLAHPKYCGDDKGYLGRMGYCNCIVYYDSETLNELYRETFDFPFKCCDENENLIVIEGKEHKLLVIPKANKRIFNVGIGLEYWNTRVYLFKDRVYFQDENKMLCVSTLEETDGDVTVKTVPLVKWNISERNEYEPWNSRYEGILALTYINHQVNILTHRGGIYTIVGKEIQFKTRFQRNMTNRYKIIKVLSEYGFDWGYQPVFDWLNTTDYYYSEVLWPGIIKLKNAIVFRHGDVLIVGTSRRVVHIYHKMYRQDGELKLYNTRPTRRIDLNELFPMEIGLVDDDFFIDCTDRVPVEFKKIVQIDVVERKNGHAIIILHRQKLATLEFTHDNFKRSASEYTFTVKKRSRPCDLS